MPIVIYLAIMFLTSSSKDVTSQSMRSMLHKKAKYGHKVLAYNKLWHALPNIYAIKTNNSMLTLFYTNRVIDKSNRVVKDKRNGWNREHLWPQSRGSKLLPMKSDLHHIRPVDASVNRSRSNLDFGAGTKPEGEAPNTFLGKVTFEPRDAIKGDIARSMFYMDVRYEGKDNEPDLQLVKKIQTRKGTRVGNLCQLLIWHKTDPVDDIEYTRHERIVKIQGNRNPFIDTPSAADNLYDKDC
ncbi:MAG: endonuclease [Hyphomicrobiaceae bacterium]|nr:endonuclease [Hyphomicrobiaceae bacterium]